MLVSQEKEKQRHISIIKCVIHDKNKWKMHRSKSYAIYIVGEKHI